MLSMLASRGVGGRQSRVDATQFAFVNDPETFTATAFWLAEGRLGTVKTQESGYGTVVKTKSGVFVVHAVNKVTYRIDFPDGSYVQAGAVDRDVHVSSPTLLGRCSPAPPKTSK
jgi:hypothetical protein